MEGLEVARRGVVVPRDADKAVLLVDKPAGWTSFDVIRKLKKLLPGRKLGHTGTLDPMATGLLIVLVGHATRLMEDFLRFDKDYTGTLRLGECTPSYDAETQVTVRKDASHLTLEAIQGVCNTFSGTILQIPPMYSAVKVKGERLYKKARRGETIVRKPHEVHVHAFDIIRRQGPDISFHVRCTKGTYIRSLVHDVGEKLSVGAHLIALRRTAIGPFHVDRAWEMPSLVDALTQAARTTS